MVQPASGLTIQVAELLRFQKLVAGRLFGDLADEPLSRAADVFDTRAEIGGKSGGLLSYLGHRSWCGTDRTMHSFSEKCSHSDVPCQAFLASNRHLSLESDWKSWISSPSCRAVSVSNNFCVSA